MNLTHKKKKLIRKTIIPNIPEIKKALVLKKEIIEELREKAMSLLNEDELWLFNNYPGLLLLQYREGKVYQRDSIYVSGNKSCIEELYTKYRSYYYYWGNQNEYRAEEIYEYCELRYEDSLLNYPKTYDEDLENLTSLFDKCDINDLINKIKEFNICLVEAEKKLSVVEAVLSSKLINLSDIKRYSPKLYNIIKSVE